MANLSAKDLSDALAGGLIREDVIDQVYNLDEGIPTPFTDMVRKDSFKSTYSEWSLNDLNTIDTANAVVDGADTTDDQSKVGTRVGNRAQISDKMVQISTLAEEVDSIGSQGKMAYQTAKRLMDLRRDVEAIALGRQASVVDDGSSTAGKTAGFGAWLETNTDFGTTGAAGGFNTSTKIVDAPTPGSGRALTMTKVLDQVSNCFDAGSDPSVLMSVPGVIVGLNRFLFSSAGDPYRAAPTSNVSGAGKGVAQTAQGYINVMITDFGTTLELVPNRLQQTYLEAFGGGTSQSADVFLIDPAFVGLGFLYGYRVEALAKLGHSERKLISTSWMTKVYREDAHAMIADIDPTQAVTA